MRDFLNSFSPQKAALLAHLTEFSVRTDGPFTLRSGKTSSWYIDARQTTFSGSGAVVVGDAVLELIPEDVECVGGLTLGADPIAIATAVAAARAGRHLDAFSVRKEAKDHGAGGRLVGPVHAGSKVVVLEDTTTTGGALCEAIDALIEADVHVVKAIALVDRSGGAARDRVEAIGIPYFAIVTPTDLGVGD